MAPQQQQGQSVILVAEDEVLVRNLIATLLHRDGHFVLAAAHGVEALELSRSYQHPINLLITDIQMPRMNGLDLTHYIMRERPGIKVLLISAHLSSKNQGTEVELPFLRKPFLPAALRETVRNLLRVPSDLQPGSLQP